MNSSIINISEILSNAELFISAGFSNGYNFNENTASTYFDKLIEDATLPSPIFSGILIMEKSENTFTIVDGLQRITTISLLLSALCEKYKNTSKQNEQTSNKILQKYLLRKNVLNPEAESEPKLKLTGEEQKIYKKIISTQELNKKEMDSNLAKTYQAFLKKIEVSEVSGTNLFKILSKIQFMMILIENSEVSTRELYQTINKNKKDSQMNLIYDFVNQKIAKNKDAQVYWQKAITAYKDLEIQNLFESFIRDFLLIQHDGKKPDEDYLYSSFKLYFIKISKYQNTEQIFKNLYKYSKYYIKITNADFENSEIRKQIMTINKNNAKDTYSYLMEVLDDLENGHINKDVFLNILLMINSLVQNKHEDLLSNVMIDFSSLSKEINKMLVLKDYTPNIVDEEKLTINEINNLSNFEV